MSTPQNTNPLALSLRLGWLTVETFGRLRRWARSGQRVDFSSQDPARRFTFSDREPALFEQLVISIRQFQEIAHQLLPDLPPPIPGNRETLLQAARQDTGAVWLEFETWSREAWNTLQVQNSLAGQAFSAGGSLADTYWHAQGAGPDKLKELLRDHRLKSIANRLDALNEWLPDHSAQVIHHTLYRWCDAPQVDRMDGDQKEYLVKRLESQARVWRDLIFGQMRAEDYLTAADRQAIRRNAFLLTLLLTTAAGLLAWFGVLLLSGSGRAILVAYPEILGGTSGTTSNLPVDLLDWQNWTSLLAALSSVVVVLSGFITRLSGWMISFYRWAAARLTLRKIHHRTYRGWELRPSSEST